MLKFGKSGNFWKYIDASGKKIDSFKIRRNRRVATRYAWFSFYILVPVVITFVCICMYDIVQSSYFGFAVREASVVAVGVTHEVLIKIRPTLGELRRF